MSDTKKKPNIILITTDQQRGDCLGISGHPCLSTPHLDRLGYEGVNFKRAYSNCPICIPARTTMITGIDAHNNGKAAYAQDYRVDRSADQMLGGLITNAGYQTQIIGKTHWHTEQSFRAGFENVIQQNQLYDARRAHHGRPTARFEGMGFNEMNPSLSQYPQELYSSDWTVDQSIRFLDYRDKTVPFFLWVSLTDPHPPITIHEPFYSMYDNTDIPEPIRADWTENDDECPAAIRYHLTVYNPGPMKPWELKKTRAVYYGMITNLDHQLGRLFGRLMMEKEWDDTWVIFTTDHGEHLGDFGNFTKSSFLESSARLPFLIRPPKEFDFSAGEESGSLVELADILPTIAEIAGAEIPEDVMGKSLIPIIKESSAKVRDFLHGHIDHSHMYHDGRYKYLYFGEDGKELLFDLQNDPEEKENIIATSSEADRLRKAFIAHLEEEKHEHLVDGKLLNYHEKLKSSQQLKQQNCMGWGGAAW